jgi:hypothetical protein
LVAACDVPLAQEQEGCEDNALIHPRPSSHTMVDEVVVACVYVCVRACVCVRARARACVCVRARVFVRVCVCARWGGGGGGVHALVNQPNDASIISFSEIASWSVLPHRRLPKTGRNASVPVVTPSFSQAVMMLLRLSFVEEVGALIDWRLDGRSVTHARLPRVPVHASITLLRRLACCSHSAPGPDTR